MAQKPLHLYSLLWLWLSLTLSCAPKLYTSKPQISYLPVKEEQMSDTALTGFLAPYKRGVDTMINVAIGTTDIPLTKAAPESTLGNLMVDAMFKKALQYHNKVVGAVMNYGGIRVDYVAPGAITVGKVYEIMPFDNLLTIIEVPGSVLKQWCDLMAGRKGWPIAGITYTIKDKKAIDVRLNKEPINDNIVYAIATNDYLANGGDQCDFLKDLRRKNTSLFIRDVLIEEIKSLTDKGLPVHPVLSQRVVYAE